MMLSELSRVFLERVRHGSAVLDGLPIAQVIRDRAAIRLGADLVAGMALPDVVDYLLEEPENDG